MTDRNPIEPTPLILLGGGGHAAVVADSLPLARWRALGYLADEPGEHAPGVASPDGPAALPWLGSPHDLETVLERHGHGLAMVHAAVGDATLRKEWLDRVEVSRWATIVAPSAVISPAARLGAGVFVGPQAVINARAVIGDGVIVNSGAIVEHDCRIGAFAHLAPGSALGGAVEIGARVLVGLNAVAVPGVRVGRDAVLGAGAVAVQDVPERRTAAGVPARILGETATRF